MAAAPVDETKTMYNQMLPLLLLCQLLSITAIWYELYRMRVGNNGPSLYDVWKAAREWRRKRRNRDFI